MIQPSEISGSVKYIKRASTYKPASTALGGGIFVTTSFKSNATILPSGVKVRA